MSQHLMERCKMKNIVTQIFPKNFSSIDITIYHCTELTFIQLDRFCVLIKGLTYRANACIFINSFPVFAYE